MAAPKGNKFAIGGSSKKFKSNEELEDLINQYFKECNENTKTIYDKNLGLITVPHPIPYTIEGLCDVLDCVRDTLLNYEKAKGYEVHFDTIKRAKNKIQRNKLERGLMGDSHAAVTIFDLKNNHGYKDKTEVERTNLTPLDGKSLDELLKIANDLQAK